MVVGVLYFPPGDKRVQPGQGLGLAVASLAQSLCFPGKSPGPLWQQHLSGGRRCSGPRLSPPGAPQHRGLSCPLSCLQELPCGHTQVSAASKHRLPFISLLCGPCPLFAGIRGSWSCQALPGHSGSQRALEGSRGLPSVSATRSRSQGKPAWATGAQHRSQTSMQGQ